MIEFRKYQDSDYEKLCNLIVKIWKYDSFTSKKKAFMMAEYDLLKVLNEASFSELVLNNNEVVGFIFGSIGKIEKDKTKLDLVKKKVRRGLSGLMVIISDKKLSKINNLLLEDSKRNYDAKLCFLGVDGLERHKGYGLRLYKDFVNYLKENNVKNFYLFSDNYSNYKFYEKNGMRLRSTRYIKLPFQAKEDNAFFLYDKEL